MGAIPGLFFLYFRLLNTIDKKLTFDKSLPMTGFEPWLYGFGGNRSTSWPITTAPVKFFRCQHHGLKIANLSKPVWCCCCLNWTSRFSENLLKCFKHVSTKKANKLPKNLRFHFLRNKFLLFSPSGISFKERNFSFLMFQFRKRLKARKMLL